MKINGPTDLGPRYQHLRDLGAGGAGQVFLVRDRFLEKELALKLLLSAPDGHDESELLKKEFAVLAEIEHPGIARVYDFGYIRGRPYYTHEYVAGESLRCGLPLGPSFDVLRLSTEIADALAFLHRNEILHLDVKPGNIVLTPQGALPSRPVLIDFGLFRRGLRSSPDTLRRGSLPYMAPEYFGDEALGPWTDVYALGVTFYQMVTGRLPRRAEGAGPLLPPSRLSSRLPDGLQEVILKCLAVDRRRRFSSAIELLSALRRLTEDEPVKVSRDTSAARTVGRAAELARVERFLDDIVRRRADHLGLLVTGRPGVGHSHFFREVKVRAQTRGFLCYLETGYPGQAAAPGSLLRFLGAHVKSEAPEDDGRRARGRFRSFLSRLAQPEKSTHRDAPEKERRLRRAAELALAVGAVHEPLVLAVDGLQYWDEISIALLMDLVLHLHSGKPEERPPVGVIVGYREEGLVTSLLREFTEIVLEQSERVLTLQPLDADESLELYRRRGGAIAEDATGLAIFQETGGSPTEIVAVAARDGSSVNPTPRHRERATSRSVSSEGRTLVLALHLLERPATGAELSRLAEVPRRRAPQLLRELQKGEFVLEIDVEPGRRCWVTGPAAGGLLERVRPATRRRLHRKIAELIVRQRGAGADARLLEAVRHFRGARHRPGVVKHGLPVARYFRSTSQNRRALNVFHWVLEALPSNDVQRRLEATLEIASLHMRVGNFDEGIRRLRELYLAPRRPSASGQVKVLLWLATLHGRGGEYRRAESLFSEGLRAARQRSGALSEEEFLFFLNERAAVKTILGRSDEALRICEDGLRLAKRSRRHSIREVALNLHATKASIALRAFDYDRAIEDFEASLSLAEAIGSLESQALIFNNLGMVYGQRDRYQDAIRAFREAEEICLRLDTGPSLTSIYGNLAILHAKTGAVEEAERFLGEAARLGPETAGRKQAQFFEHARGLCLVYRGRYGSALKHLEAAIDTGKQIGDRYVVSFDEVYRAEARIFLAGYGEATTELERLSEATQAAPVRRMALARRALSAALTGQTGSLEEIVREYEVLAGAHRIPFLDHSNEVFLGWAHSISGFYENALSLLDSAEEFFRNHALRPSLALVECIRAECYFLADELERAEKLLMSVDASPSEFAAVFRALLAARLLLAKAATLDDRSRCMDLLSEAGSYLIGNELPEWNMRLETLRHRLLTLEEVVPRGVKDMRQEISARLEAEASSDYREAPYFARWVSGFRLPGDWVELGRNAREMDGSSRPSPRREEGASTTRTQTRARGEQHTPYTRDSLVTKSSGMRRLARLLDKLKDSEATVLLRGETGAGKELVARVLHHESRRADRPFQVVDCATIPPGLLETELFGARAGAFTDQREDRAGILAAASGGTVLVDEVAGADQEAQAKLLRVLSEKRFRPVGAETETELDVRFVFSTARNLEEEVKHGRFRGDLLHRINVISVDIPPLRERPEDMAGLVGMFVRERIARPFEASSAVVEKLRTFSWPGNVRELKNVLDRTLLENSGKLTVEAIERVQMPSDDTRATCLFPRSVLADRSLPDLKKRLERDFIVYHFRRLGGDTEALCHFLGVKRRQFYRRCERLGIQLREERRRLRRSAGS